MTRQGWRPPQPTKQERGMYRKLAEQLRRKRLKRAAALNLVPSGASAAVSPPASVRSQPRVAPAPEGADLFSAEERGERK